MFQHVVKACNSPLSVLAAKNSTRDFSSKFLNHVELLGRVGREPAKVGENDAVAFPFYTENVVKLKDGTFKTYPSWHRVLVAKKSIADAVFETVERGQRCYISGRIAYRAPEVTESGKMINSNQAVIICDQIIFLEKSRKQRTEETGETGGAESVIEPPKEAILN